MAEENREKCTACNGSGVSKPNFQDVKDDAPDYQSLQCLHCGGSGKEPG